MYILGGIAVVALVGVIIWLAREAEKKKRAAFLAWATAHGWTYAPERRTDFAEAYRFLDRLRQGHSRYAEHVLEGELEGRPARAFTYHYAVTTSTGKSTTTHHYYSGVVLVELARQFPELCIRPENLLDKLGGMVGLDDIDFESVEFSKKFSVRSPDKKLAYDFCHTGMMEYLLQNPKTAIELENNVLVLYDGRALKAEVLDDRLVHLGRIRTLIPEYLFRD